MKAGDEVEMTFESGKVTLAPIEQHPRAGWAEDARAIAEAGDDGLVWPEFGNLDDEELVW